MSSPTAAVPSWKTEFDDRIKVFSEVCKIDESVVKSKLSDYGADGSSSTSLDMLDSEETLPMSELFSMFVDSGLTKKGNLRLAVSHLRGKSQIETLHPTSEEPTIASALEKVFTANRPKNDWSDGELLKIYDQDATEVAEILRKRTHGRPCIVFNRDGSVNVEVSLKLIKLAKRQATHTNFMVEGKLVSVFRAGEFLAKPLDESPFHPGVALIEGICPQSNTDWNGVSQKIRIMARLHVRNIETAALTKKAMQAINKETRKLNETEFSDEYQEAALLYQQLEDQGNLPTLKILSNETKSEKSGKVDTGFAPKTLNLNTSGYNRVSEMRTIGEGEYAVINPFSRKYHM